MAEDLSKRLGKMSVFSIEDGTGNFVPIGKVLSISYGPPIECSPVPGRNGIEYVPDWHGITRFG